MCPKEEKKKEEKKKKRELEVKMRIKSFFWNRRPIHWTSEKLSALSDVIYTVLQG